MLLNDILACLLPLPFLFLLLSSFSPGQPSMGHLLRRISVSGSTSWESNKNMRYQRGPGKMMSGEDQGKRALKMSERFEHI